MSHENFVAYIHGFGWTRDLDENKNWCGRDRIRLLFGGHTMIEVWKVLKQIGWIHSIILKTSDFRKVWQTILISFYHTHWLRYGFGSHIGHIKLQTWQLGLRDSWQMAMEPFIFWRRRYLKMTYYSMPIWKPTASKFFVAFKTANNTSNDQRHLIAWTFLYLVKFLVLVKIYCLPWFKRIINESLKSISFLFVII